MTDELGKATRRRAQADPAYTDIYFVGSGIDVGAGQDGLTHYFGNYPAVTHVYEWDKKDGDAQEMDDVDDDTYDWLHSSHCLEHLQAPDVALNNWIRVVKPGGYLIVVVPDQDMYERGNWPSQFNPEHAWSFTVSSHRLILPKSLNVLDLIAAVSDRTTLERLIVLRTHFDSALPTSVDQSRGRAECAIEFVLRKMSAQ